MPFIRTNLQAGLVARQLEQVNRDFTTNLERLSTGLRLNRPDDNPGFFGMKVAQELQISSIDQGVINAQNAAGMLQTAEEGITQITDILQRAHDLAVTAADSTVDESSRAQANTELKALITGPDDGESELKQILDNVKYNGIKLLSESTSTAMIETNTIKAGALASTGTYASDKYSSGMTLIYNLGNELATDFTQGTRWVNIGIAGGDSLETDANGDTIAASGRGGIAVGDVLLIEGYDDATEKTYRSQVLVSTVTDDKNFQVVKLSDGNKTIDNLSELQNLTPGSNGDTLKIHRLANTQIVDSTGAEITTDRTFDFDDGAGNAVSNTIASRLSVGVVLNQSGEDETPPLSPVRLNITDTNPLNMANAIETAIENALGGEYGEIEDNGTVGNKHIDVIPVARMARVNNGTTGDDAVTFAAGGGPTNAEDLGIQEITSTILEDSHTLLTTGEGTNVAAGDIGKKVANLDEVKFKFVTTTSAGINSTPRMRIKDTQLESYTEDVLFNQTYSDDGIKGNDKFMITIDGEEVEVDIDAAGKVTENAAGETVTPYKSITSILEDLRAADTDAAAADEGTSRTETWANQAIYAGDLLEQALQDAIDNATIYANQVTVGHSLDDGKLSISSGLESNSSQVKIGDIIEPTSGTKPTTNLGLAEGREDFGTGSSFTFRLGGNGDTFSFTIDVLGASRLGEDQVNVSNLDIGTQAGAAQAINRLEDAIDSVSSTQTKIGAAINHMSRRMHVLETHSENLQGQKARFEEIDFTEETRRLASLQILLQSGTAALAQANVIPQTLLQLLA